MKRIGASIATLAFPLAGSARSSENLEPQTDFFTFGPCTCSALNLSVSNVGHDNQRRMSVRIFNRNDNAKGAAKDFCYYVEAARCTDHSMVAKIDPRIEKAGR